MSTVERSRTARGKPADEAGFPWLENGERMDRSTFHARYLQTPPEFRAELIGGVVYLMPSPFLNRHGRTDARIAGWLFHYAAATPGTQVQLNTTTILNDENEPQPDAALLIDPDRGGQTREGDDYTYGPPELVVEVAWSSRSIDLGAKLLEYERAGIREYLVVELGRQIIHWHESADGRFRPIDAESGIYRSRVFPGLRLDAEAFFSDVKPRLLQTLDGGLGSPEHAAFRAELAARLR